ncbi:uncharacterized protein LOC113218241 isoform X1 [Frankliniella occidentalis]|uniref:Uncharacterized protein LOC113218241 isoform X1 n=1 Tax=Frankliniella occidentalis TaxID=133901 RepID=A0A6J1TS13_FRAOC|nr:uncharacterized protein LOC113218241 isoform X1 [Frankliniella occidentalis]
MADTTCEMDALGDDELLLVLQYVGAEDLLRCRAVCRRLRDLAAVPELWRWRTVGDPSGWVVAPGSPSVSSPILRLAPCLHLLVMRFGASQEFASSSEMKCAVARLALDVIGDFSGGIIRNQLALGRLRELSVIFYNRDCANVNANFHDVLDVVLAAKGLTVLEVDMDVDLYETGSTAREYKHEAKCESSLKRLAYDSQASDPLLKMLLDAHAATLEEVDLHILRPSDMWDVAPNLVDSLIKMPNLKKLTCPPLHGMHRLQACKTLTALTLNVYALNVMPGMAELESLLHSAGQLLRTATQLTHVDITIPNNESLTLLAALADSEQSGVLSLTLKCFNICRYPEFYEVLAPVLPNLPKLQSLTLDVPSDMRLLGINKVMMMLRPETAPCLSQLAIRSAGCLHIWLTNKSVLDLLKANTLQIKWLGTLFCHFNECHFGCHEIGTDQVTWESVKRLPKIMSLFD